MIFQKLIVPGGFDRLLCLLVASIIVLASSIHVQAGDPPLVDTIQLKSGGVLYGTAEEIVENKQNLYLVTTTDGTMLKLKKSQVAQVLRPTEEMRQYIEFKNTMADTVDGHWEMQQWCLDHRLPRQREYHLIRIIELDPDHKDARARLDHKDIDGVWVHWDHFMLNQGYVKDSRGVHRLPQAIEMNEREEAAEQVVQEWNKQLRTLITKIIKRNDQAALRTLQGIKDPAAVPGLMKIFNEENQDLALKKMIIDILGQIESGASQNALVVIATTLPDKDLDLAERAVNLLRKPHFNREGIANTVMHWLRPSPGSSVKSRLMVNRAAWLIGKIEYQGAIRPLIDALVTIHKVPSGAGSGNMSFSQNSDGTSFSPGQKQQFVELPFENQAVLDTLRLLSPGGVDFHFNESAWMDWFIRQNSMGTYQIGRDQ